MQPRKIRIIASTELTELRLNTLLGRTGTTVVKGESDGFWVELDEPYKEEKEWFIPGKSLQIIP